MPILGKIDQEIQPLECSQTDRHTHPQTDRNTDANRFYNLSHAICYSYGTDNNEFIIFLHLTMKYRSRLYSSMSSLTYATHVAQGLKHSYNLTQAISRDKFQPCHWPLRAYTLLSLGSLRQTLCCVCYTRCVENCA